MISRELTDAAARLLAGATCPLDRVVTLLPQLLPGCGAATAARWRDGKAIEMAASDRSVAELLASELERGSGPVIGALRSGHTWCADTRRADRWPGFRADALRAGVRSLVTLAERDGATVVTVTLYGVKPNSLEPGTAALALLFIASGAVVPEGGAVLPAAATEVAEGAGSGSGRPQSATVSALDEATSLLMRALSATEQEAGGILQATSRECGADIDVVAPWLAAQHARAAARICGPAGTEVQQPSARRPAVRATVRSAGRNGERVRGQARPPRQRWETLPAVMSSAGPSPWARDTRNSRLLTAMVEQAVRLRKQLARAASSLAQTEARLADTFERSAENLPNHARHLAAMATAARQYSRHVDQLAEDFSQDGGRPRRRDA